MKPAILVVDDDTAVCELLQDVLNEHVFAVHVCHNGLDALALAQREPGIALVLLDMMLPDINGLQVLQQLQKWRPELPVIMLTGLGSESDVVVGLEMGADDYIVKPFEAKEVTARIKAVLRRCGSKDEENKGVYDFDNLHLDMNRYELKVKGKVVDAPPKELELLACLAGHPNRVYTRDQLLDEVWGFEYYGDSRTIDVHVKRLREKLEGASEQWNLKTVWGVGYKFEVKE